MNLSKEMKQLMAYCYTRNNAIHYEYILDKRDSYQAIRLFFSERHYLLLEVTDQPDMIRVSHFEIVKSCYYPSPRVGYLNLFFKKYRSGYFNGHSIALVPLTDLLNILNKISIYDSDFESSKDRYSSNYWRTVKRASGRC